MTMSEVEVDRITQRVYTALNSGLNEAVARVVIDEIENATEAQAAEFEAIREDYEETSKRFAKAWRVAFHEDEFAIDGVRWVRADKIRAALGGLS